MARAVRPTRRCGLMKASHLVYLGAVDTTPNWHSATPQYLQAFVKVRRERKRFIVKRLPGPHHGGPVHYSRLRTKDLNLFPQI